MMLLCKCFHLLTILLCIQGYGKVFYFNIILISSKNDIIHCLILIFSIFHTEIAIDSNYSNCINCIT